MIGIEIGDTRMRAAVRSGRRAADTYDIPFSVDALDDAVLELQALAGDVLSISLAFGLAHLHVKQVKLPPVTHDARRQMLMVEPERWFAMPTGTVAAIALDGDGALAHAADGAFVEACVAAFARWAPVQRVEAAPVAVLRAFKAAGQAAASAVLDAGPGELGFVTIEDGKLRSVRRVRAENVDATALDAQGIPSVASTFTAAYGAALPADDDPAAMLLTPQLERRFARVLRRRLVTWSAGAIAAICTAVWSLGVSRERLREAIDAEVTIARQEASAANASVVRAQTIDRELAAIVSTTSARADALASLAALGAGLPAEAVAQRVRMVGAEWQVEGNAVTASAVLAALAAEPRFDNVRFLAPSNRFRDGTEDRETFAIAFAVR